MRDLAVLSFVALTAGTTPAIAMALSVASAARSDRVASYQIDARLDPVRRLLSGTEIITWRNATTHPTSELRLHLYYNAWRNDRSSYLRSAALSGLPNRGLQGPSDWGYCNVASVSLLPEGAAGASTPLALKTGFIQPDDGRER